VGLDQLLDDGQADPFQVQRWPSPDDLHPQQKYGAVTNRILLICASPSGMVSNAVRCGSVTVRAAL
jgi:hypothetical protein